MAYEVSRRNFLKGAAAMTVAAAASTLLAGCGEQPDNGYVLGEYKLYFTPGTDYSWSDSQNKAIIIPEIKIKGVSNSVTLLKKYEDVFAATVGKESLKLEADTMNRVNVVQGATTACKPTFTTTDKALYQKLVAGTATIKLKVTLSAQDAYFEYNLPNKTITPAKA